MKISSELWQPDISREIYLFKLSNERVEVHVSNYGCTIAAIKIQDKTHKSKNIVLGYSTLQEYLDDKYFTGCIVGRFAGRIRGSTFNINNNKYNLTANENGNHLHGGARGFNKKIFSIQDSGCDKDRCFVKFEATSAHLEEGYPGELYVAVTISLNMNNEISICYEARTDAATHVNLTHHHYFNLGGDTSPGWDQHLSLYANEYLGQDDSFIPDGTLKPVKNSPNDFTTMRPIKLAATDKGFNEYFVLSGEGPGDKDAILRDSHSGLTMELSTTYPCIVLYSGDYLSQPFSKSQGICLETQFFPDAPNQPHLPSTLLMPGNIYFHETKLLLRNII